MSFHPLINKRHGTGVLPNLPELRRWQMDISLKSFWIDEYAEEYKPMEFCICVKGVKAKFVLNYSGLGGRDLVLKSRWHDVEKQLSLASCRADSKELLLLGVTEFREAYYRFEFGEQKEIETDEGLFKATALLICPCNEDGVKIESKSAVDIYVLDSELLKLDCFK